MDIRDVGTNPNGTPRVVRGHRLQAEASAPRNEKPTGEVFFENSGSLGRARALIDRLVQAPEIRTDVVTRAKALLEGGLLDGAEAATRAASALVDGHAASGA